MFWFVVVVFLALMVIRDGEARSIKRGMNIYRHGDLDGGVR